MKVDRVPPVSDVYAIDAAQELFGCACIRCGAPGALTLAQQLVISSAPAPIGGVPARGLPCALDAGHKRASSATRCHPCPDRQASPWGAVATPPQIPEHTQDSGAGSGSYAAGPQPVTPDKKVGKGRMTSGVSEALLSALIGRSASPRVRDARVCSSTTSPSAWGGPVRHAARRIRTCPTCPRVLQRAGEVLVHEPRNVLHGLSPARVNGWPRSGGRPGAFV